MLPAGAGASEGAEEEASEGGVVAVAGAAGVLRCRNPWMCGPA